MIVLCSRGRKAFWCLLDAFTFCWIKSVCDLHDRKLMDLAFGGEEREAA